MKKILIIIAIILLALTSLFGAWRLWTKVLAPTPVAGCTSPEWTNPSGDLEIFTDGETSPDGNWTCVAESPEGPWGWKRAEAPPTPEPQAPINAPAPADPATCTGIVVNGACSEEPFQNPETARCFDYDETGIDNTATYHFNLTSGRLVIDAVSVDGKFNSGGLLIVDQKGDHTFTVHNGAYCWVPPQHADWAYTHRLAVLKQFVPNPVIVTIP